MAYFSSSLITRCHPDAGEARRGTNVQRKERRVREEPNADFETSSKGRTSNAQRSIGERTQLMLSPIERLHNEVTICRR